MKQTVNTSGLVTAVSSNGQITTEMSRAQYNKAPDYTLAQSILGTDFITPEEVSLARTIIVYTDEQITALAESLPSEDVLNWCKDNNYAVMPAPSNAMSLLDVRVIKSSHFYSGVLYTGHKFAREDKTSFGWLAIKKTPVSNSTNEKWKEQRKLISVLEYVPNAAEMSWFITTYFEVRGVRLFEKNIYVRTSSFDSDGKRVSVGLFGYNGLDVSSWYDYITYGYISISSAVKKLCTS